MSSRTSRRIVFGKGIAQVLLGAAHVVAIPFEHARVQTQMASGLVAQYTFWFGAIAAFFVLLGVVDLLASKHLEEGAPLGRALVLTTSLLSTGLSLIGLWVLGINPGIVLLVSGLLGLFALSRESSSEPAARLC